MLRHGISALPVVDDRGDLLGVISEADLITKPAQGGGRRRGQTAGGMMSAPADSAHLDDTVGDLARRMIDDHRKHLPVVAAADGDADLGAVADRVIREARCPVVVVPAD
jgi:CBS domain-containing protein